MPETVVILSPIKPRTPERITQRFMNWLSSCIPPAEKAGYECVICLDISGEGDKGEVPHAQRSIRIAHIRNRMLEEFVLRRSNLCNEWVVWLDSDVVDSNSPTLIPDLIDASKRFNAVVAPAIFVERQDGRPHQRFRSEGERLLQRDHLCFYDTSGFVHGDSKATPQYPWTRGNRLDADHFELDGSVGCCLCSSGRVYDLGVRFDAPQNPIFTEHHPFCQQALGKGYRSVVSYKNPVYHAHLPSYGERFH